MTIVIISTYYNKGGAEWQALYEKKVLDDNGMNCWYITFDPDLQTSEKLHNHINFNNRHTFWGRKLKNFIIDFYLLRKLRKIFKEIKPDIIHIHNISYAFITIAKACEGYYTIQTLHDFGGVCVNYARCIRRDKLLCNEFNFKSCWKECYSKNLLTSVLFCYYKSMQWLIWFYRKKYIQLLITPSEALAEALRSINIKATVINNIMSVSDFYSGAKDWRCKKKNIAFIGLIREVKGIYELLGSYNHSNYNNTDLYIIGSLGKDLDKERFYKLINDSGAIYMGKLEHDQLTDFLNKDETYAVIIPSLWMENYPNVALEGFASNCIVTGSNRGGIPELVIKKELLFDILSSDNIKSVLQYIDNMDEKERIEICKEQMSKLLKNNSPDTYLKKLAECTHLHF